MREHIHEPAHDHVVFRAAPPSVRSLVAAVMEPLVALAVLIGAHLAWGQPVSRGVWIVALLVIAMGVPGRDRFGEPPGRAALEVALSWAGVLGILLLVGYALEALDVLPRPVAVAWRLATPVAQWAAVQAGRAYVRRRRIGARPRRDVVVIGSDPWGARVARTLAGRPEDQLRVVGFFDDRDDERLDADARERRLGALKDAAAWIREHGVSEVHITLPLHSHPRMQELLEQLQRTTASVFYVPDVTIAGVIQGRLEDRDGLPVVGLCETPFTGINLLVKRASDIVLASLILVLVSPVMIGVAIGVRLSGPGPVIFRQRRNGLDGREIVVYKFRSMRVAEDGAVVQQATRGDPRLTRFGAFIRRTSLDELPQFFNVLQGRMSVVGPRPHAVAHNELYRDIVKAYNVRHKVRPGITGWAQVNGHRGETDTLEKMQARVEYDLEYLRHWSLALDLRIIARTVRLVFGDRKAY